MPELRINVVDPGYTATDLNDNSGPQPVEQGTDAIVRLAPKPRNRSRDFASAPPLLALNTISTPVHYAAARIDGAARGDAGGFGKVISAKVISIATARQIRQRPREEAPVIAQLIAALDRRIDVGPTRTAAVGADRGCEGTRRVHET